ncbi:hypothetical protein OIU76_022150 [Salix suchowensis]|nr:hypothetical protein OIU76_022150 [Salix suchowensis]
MNMKDSIKILITGTFEQQSSHLASIAVITYFILQEHNMNTNVSAPNMFYTITSSFLEESNIHVEPLC